MFKELLDDLRQSKCVLVGLGESFTLKNPEDELKYIQFYKTLKEKLGAIFYKKWCISCGGHRLWDEAKYCEKLQQTRL